MTYDRMKVMANNDVEYEMREELSMILFMINSEQTVDSHDYDYLSSILAAPVLHQ